MKTKLQNEPVAAAGIVALVVRSTLGLLVAFGVEVTDAQMVAIDTFVGAIVTLAAIIYARRRVTPTAAFPPPLPPAK